ncbi:hypothetical protein C0993_010399, partial [Termitomyces sp. T159_Od127]
EKLRKEKEEEETKERLREQERTKRMERQLLERQYAERQRAEKERQDRERAEKDRQARERRDWERAEKERLDKQRQIEKEILERQRLDNERKKELEREKKEREEREERERRERRRREEKERREKEEKERREREREEKERREKEREEKERRERQERERQEKERQEKEMERRETERQEMERQEMERERQEKQRQEMENARLDRERWEREHLERLEAARVQEELEQEERRKREEEEREREKTREIHFQRDRQREYVQETQTHGTYDCRRMIHFHPVDEVKDRSQFPPDRNFPQSTDSDFSDACDTDDLELLSPPPSIHPLQTRKESIHERPLDPTIGRSSDNISRLSSSTDRPAARSPPTIWKPSSFEDDAPTKLLSTELGRRSSVTSIKSTSSMGVRPIIVDEPIPERSDSEAEYLDNDTGYPETEDWHPVTKSRERERRREYRNSSDGPRGDESYVPHFPNARAHRAEDPRSLPPRDRYDSEQSHRNLRYHRSEEIANQPSSSVRAPLRREASFYEEHDDKYHTSRSIRARTSFEDRGGPYQPPLQARVPSRPSSTLNDERDYYDQAGYRSYPTPPSSASRPSIRDHMTPPSRYPSGHPYSYSSEPRSNTLKYAQQQESPLSRRPSESRPSMNRGPSFTQNYSEGKPFFWNILLDILLISQLRAKSTTCIFF